jgi:hypothetical protein
MADFGRTLKSIARFQTKIREVDGFYITLTKMEKTLPHRAFLQLGREWWSAPTP